MTENTPSDALVKLAEAVTDAYVIGESHSAGIDAAAAVIADALAERDAEIARLREDAARYQWLRDCSCPPHNFYISVPDEFAGTLYAPDDVDAYIDAARAALGSAKV